MLVAFQSGIREAYTAKSDCLPCDPPPPPFSPPVIVPHGKFGPAHEVIVQRKTEGISSSSYLIWLLLWKKRLLVGRGDLDLQIAPLGDFLLQQWHVQVLCSRYKLASVYVLILWNAIKVYFVCLYLHCLIILIPLNSVFNKFFQPPTLLGDVWWFLSAVSQVCRH